MGVSIIMKYVYRKIGGDSYAFGDILAVYDSHDEAMGLCNTLNAAAETSGEHVYYTLTTWWRQ